MLGGVIYQQFSSTKPKAAKDVEVPQSMEEQQKLLDMQSSSENLGNEKQVTDSGQEK